MIYNELTQGLQKVTVKVKNGRFIPTAMQNRLFGRVIGTSDDFVGHNYAESGIILSPETIRGEDPTAVNEGQSFDERHIYGIYLFPEKNINMQEAQNRLFDEDRTGSWTLAQRQLWMLAEAREEMREGFKLAKEKLCMEAILNGKFMSTKHGEQAFPGDASLLKLSGANLSKTPVKVISEAIKKIKVKGAGARITTLILNDTDAITLATSAEWKSVCDIKNFMGNKEDMQAMGADGLSFIGTIAAVGAGPINVYSYTGVDEKGADLLPTGKAILCGDHIGEMGYTGILAVGPNGVQAKVAGTESFTVATNENGVLVHTKLQGQTAPAPIITEINRYGVLTSIS